MNNHENLRLKKISHEARETIVKMTRNGGCFIGASLSCVDLIVYLYDKYLNISKANLNNSERDYFFLSKGHSVPALYSTFLELGFLDKERLENHLKINDDIYWHPNRNIPGVEFYSGSLGHSLSIAIGIAIECKIKEQNNKVVVMVGDGELNEGSNWESILVANAYKLDNLIIIVDRNHFQANVKTESLIPLEPLKDKFAAFGCSVWKINGHNFNEIEIAFSQLSSKSGSPKVIIADTIRGKGLPSIQGRPDRWFCNFTNDEINTLLFELRAVSNLLIDKPGSNVSQNTD
jgi:transketolase